MSANDRGRTDAPSSDDEKLFASYLGDNSVLIADPHLASRNRLSRILLGLGAKQGNLHQVASAAEAVAAIDACKPKVVLCEYMLGDRPGLDILQEQRRQLPGFKDCVFALVTSSSSQSAVAAAAEEDVDTFIIKPYSVGTVKRTLMQAAKKKLLPGEYLLKIEEGKKHLLDGAPDRALEAFDEAMALDSSPTLACFYKGQAQLMKDAMGAATQDYQQGLSFNRIHYKCLIGLYEVLMREGKVSEAYRVVRKIARYFPANPKRLAEVLRLAVVTGNFADVEEYYGVFKEMPVRSDESVRYICSALIVSSIHYFENHLEDTAVRFLEMAAVSAAGRTGYLRYAIECLVKYGRIQEAENTLRRFPASTTQSVDYLSMAYLVSSRTSPVGRVIDEGRKLLKQGVESPTVYRVLIRASAEAGLSDSLNELKSEAVRKWPEEQAHFEPASV